MIKKILIFALSIIGLIAVLVLGLIAKHEVSYQRAVSHQVTQHILNNTKKWGETTTLLPHIFKKGQVRANVEKIVKKAGYRLNARAGFKSEIGQSMEFWRSVPSRICNLKVYVMLFFDKNDLLISAQGTMKEHGCL